MHPLCDGILPPEPPLTPFDPFNPRNPKERRPLPQRPFRDSWPLPPEPRLPLVDACEAAHAIPIVLELSGGTIADGLLPEASSNIEGTVMIGSPPLLILPPIEVDQAASRYRHGSLTISLLKSPSTTPMGGGPTRSGR